MSDLVERLRRSQANGNILSGNAADEIERLQSELGVWKANAETNLGEVERLQAAVDGLRQNRDLAYEKEKRLRAALERIAYYFPDDCHKFQTTEAVNMKDIAREALKGETSED